MIERKRELRQAAAALCFETLLLAGVFYTDKAMEYRDRFLPGTVINGVEAEGMTPEEVETQLGQYSITLEFRGGEKDVFDGEEFGFHYVSDGTVRRLVEEQNPFLWFPAKYRESIYTIEEPKDFDGERLREMIGKLPALQRGNMIPPRDAFLDYRDSDYVVVPEVWGTTLDPGKAADCIEAAVREETEELNLDNIEGLYEEPQILKDDEFLNMQAEELNDLAGAEILYTYPDGTVVRLGGPELREWLDEDEDGHFSRDDTAWTKHIKDYVYAMAQELDTVYKEHPFRTHDGREILVPGKGYYGWHLDKKKEIEQLTEELEEGTETEREPVYRRREASSPDDNHGFGDYYCEVDLTAQHLWIYQDGETVFETDIVSGLNDEDHRTPDGAFFAYDKKRETTLRGDKQDDGSWGYETDVDYWIRITDDGIGLHDASWRRSFGGNIWRWNGSHGCINLPVQAAPVIYDLLEEMTPIVVYY